MQKRFLGYTALLFFFFARAQTEDAWVYFVDKTGVAIALADPATILSPKAILRKQGHGVVVDERDVPVNESYIATLKQQSGISVLSKSKWFNCVYVRGAIADIQRLLALPAVDRIDFANKALNLNSKSTLHAQKITKPKNKFFVVHQLPEFDYGNASDQLAQLQAHGLHERGYTGGGMTIAIMDSGFPNVDTMEAFAQARSEGRLLDGYDFVDRIENEFAFAGSSHGTQTFSTIAAYIPGEYVGTAPDAFYYLFRTEDVASETPLEEALWVEAAERADSLGVDVINTSLGYTSFQNETHSYSPSDMDGQTAFISRGANIAFQKGMLLVTSAGNFGNSTWEIVSAPADAAGVLAIGAIDATGAYASFSSRGPTADGRIKPDVVARGLGAAVIFADGTLGTSSGTSFSSPILAGAASCLWQAFPEKTNGEIMDMIRNSSTQYAFPDGLLGYGIPNFRTPIEFLESPLGTAPKRQVTYHPNPVRHLLTVVFPQSVPSVSRLFTLQGKHLRTISSSGEQQIDMKDLNKGVYVLVVEYQGSRSSHLIVRE